MTVQWKCILCTVFPKTETEKQNDYGEDNKTNSTEETKYLISLIELFQANGTRCIFVLNLSYHSHDLQISLINIQEVCALMLVCA